MPYIGSTSDLTIVAHTDDDLLFMNPDIQEGITAGREVTTVYLTAGDAGQEDAYWQDRETGIKAAYGHMVGSDTWVDEVTTVTSGGQTFEVASSYLAAAPEIRLYFLRLPDGGRPGQGSHEFDSLTRLLDGEIETLSAIDGSATYSEQDLEGVLLGILETHQPDQIRVHDNDSHHAEFEHVDHLASAELSDRAISQYGGENFTVTSYVNYATRDLRANLSEEEAAAGLETFLAYAAYDRFIFDDEGEVLTPYAEWPARSYIADEYSVSDGTEASVSGRYFVDGDGSEDGDLAIEGARVFLLDAANGTTVAETVTDAQGDYSFANVPPGQGYSVMVEPPADLSPGLAGRAVLVSQEGGSDAAYDSYLEISHFAVGAAEQVTGVDAVVEAEPAEVETPQEVYSVEGEDAFFFGVSQTDGTILLKDWFTPGTFDSWDADEDNVYQFERVLTAADGTELAREAVRFEVMPDDMHILSVDDTLAGVPLLSADDSQVRLDQAYDDIMEDLVA